MMMIKKARKERTNPELGFGLKDPSFSENVVSLLGQNSASIEDEFKGPSNDNRLKATGLGDGLINFQAKGADMGQDLVFEEGQFRSSIEGVCEKVKQQYLERINNVAWNLEDEVVKKADPAM
ncbi:hypothetical protein QYF36_004570 [Acer negundo]|nr:hypothetical protein QYF36_004570 [Acer negundo]